MGIQLASSLVSIFAIYLLIGVVFALLFIFFGVARVDEEAQGMSLLVRLFIFPGCALLWPLMAFKWLTKSPPPLT